MKKSLNTDSTWAAVTMYVRDPAVDCFAKKSMWFWNSLLYNMKRRMQCIWVHNVRNSFGPNSAVMGVDIVRLCCSRIIVLNLLNMVDFIWVDSEHFRTILHTVLYGAFIRCVTALTLHVPRVLSVVSTSTAYKEISSKSREANFHPFYVQQITNGDLKPWHHFP